MKDIKEVYAAISTEMVGDRGSALYQMEIEALLRCQSEFLELLHRRIAPIPAA